MSDAIKDAAVAIEVHLESFTLPNFLKIKEWPDRHGFDVGHLSPAEAATYWDEIKPLWIAHVARRHKTILDDCLKNKP